MESQMLKDNMAWMRERMLAHLHNSTVADAKEYLDGLEAMAKELRNVVRGDNEFYVLTYPKVYPVNGYKPQEPVISRTPHVVNANRDRS